MLNLDSYITIDAEAIRSPNLCSRFSDIDLDRIGNAVWDGYNLDEGSRTLWKTRNEAAMDLALQIQADKNFPWPNCSNVAFPLVTIASLQFHARAYPEIINGSEVVKCRIIGEDPEGKKKARADRVSRHMSYQVTEENSTWEEQHDKLLLNYAVVGTSFIKTWFDSSVGHPVDDLVQAKDLVIDYWAKSVETAERKTHIIPMPKSMVRERVLRGVFRDVLEEAWYLGGATPQHTPEQIKSDNRAGVQQPMHDRTTTLMLLEQHVSLDLDNDGYPEPYIITIDQESKKVLRIVTRFDREEDIERVKVGKYKGQILRINAMEYFTKYGFIPSPDGGIYDIGFGVLMGPLNESVNSLVNQLIDSGTMANSGGGFLGRGAKIRGGAYTFTPFEWKRVDSTGDDLHKSMVPLPVREPSVVLLQLLSLLINYTMRIAGATDALAGENPGQNTPAETNRSMIEQGAKIYSAIFKRCWRSMKEEFKKRYLLNGIYLPERQGFGTQGGFALREDYLGDPAAIVPVADPRIASEGERLQQAVALKQAAATTPGYNPKEVELRYLKALRIDGIETVYPGPDKTGPLPNPKMMVEQAKTEREKLKLKAQQMEFLMSMEEESKLNEAKIVELKAKAAEHLANAQGVQSGHEIAAFEAAIGALKVHNESLDRQRKHLLEGMKNESENANPRGVPGMGNPPRDTGVPAALASMAGAPA